MGSCVYFVVNDGSQAPVYYLFWYDSGASLCPETLFPLETK